jgi:hypothetical protein
VTENFQAFGENQKARRDFFKDFEGIKNRNGEFSSFLIQKNAATTIFRAE